MYLKRKTSSPTISFEMLFLRVDLRSFLNGLSFLLAIYRHVEFEDAYDGILYGASVSLGFATVENIIYLLTFGADTAFLRALLPVSSHALFGVVMGYYFGRAKFAVESNINMYLLLALVAPYSLHFIYNGILTVDNLWLYLIIPFMLFLWWFGLTRVKYAHTFAMQQFRRKARTKHKMIQLLLDHFLFVNKINDFGQTI